MAQCRFALRPDGLFVGAMLGGSTLQELRIACTLSQQEREGGVSPRTSPLAQVRDAGNLLTRAGLSIPTVDVDEIHVHYSDVVDLVNHLRKMGETNSLIQRREELPRDTALASAAVYTALFGEEHSDLDSNSTINSIPATYQVIYMTGWSPDPSQPKAAKRGSATVSFEDLSKAMKDTTSKE
jgi:NADH dehydrogenase [ubiquinone] 1 alpha subcomplex assembly factor 5